jgi:hypothetical protein
MSIKSEKQYPLVMVFYLDREMMKNQELTQTFAGSVNELIRVKNFNAIAFFLPTDGEERIECINPVIAPKAQMEKINKLIKDISSSFGIGEEVDETPRFNIVDIKPRHKSTWDYTGWVKPDFDSSFFQKDWNQTLLTVINRHSAWIHQSNLISGANQIITNYRVFKIIETLEYYSVDNIRISDRYDVVIDNRITEDKIYVVNSNPDIDVERVGEITIDNIPELF